MLATELKSSLCGLIHLVTYKVYPSLSDLTAYVTQSWYWDLKWYCKQNQGHSHAHVWSDQNEIQLSTLWMHIFTFKTHTQDRMFTYAYNIFYLPQHTVRFESWTIFFLTLTSCFVQILQSSCLNTLCDEIATFQF